MFGARGIFYDSRELTEPIIVHTNKLKQLAPNPYDMVGVDPTHKVMDMGHRVIVEAD